MKLLRYIPVIFNSFLPDVSEESNTFKHSHLVPCKFSIRCVPGMVRLYEEESQEYVNLKSGIVTRLQVLFKLNPFMVQTGLSSIRNCTKLYPYEHLKVKSFPLIAVLGNVDNWNSAEIEI